MKKINGIKDVQEAGDYNRPDAGGYICRITAAEDVVDSEYLKIEYDIAEGEFKDYYKEFNEKKGFWPAKFVKSYKQKALPFFKSFCTAVTESNFNYIFDGDEHCDERTLVGKLIGLVIGEEDYTKSDGSLGMRTYVAQTLSIDRIRKGDFKVPKYKSLADGNGSSESGSSDSYVAPPIAGDEDELPFK
jgi:hypothetical protein